VGLFSFMRRSVEAGMPPSALVADGLYFGGGYECIKRALARTGDAARAEFCCYWATRRDFARNRITSPPNTPPADTGLIFLKKGCFPLSATRSGHPPPRAGTLRIFDGGSTRWALERTHFARCGGELRLAVKVKESRTVSFAH
jgi:hypothetical protein